MPLIERIQKEILFEEAARRGIISGSFLQAPEIYRDILGTSDIGSASYGQPTAPFYQAKDGEQYDIGRMSKYFGGLSRDIQALDLSAIELENLLDTLHNTTWARMELVKNRATLVHRTALAEKDRASIGGLWGYTETFTSVSLIDMDRTTSWIDTSEGVALLPNAGPESIIKPERLRVQDQTLPGGSSSIGSTPSDATDGLESTSWRVLFTLDSGAAKATYQLDAPTDLTAIQIDPIGFGLNIEIQVDDGTGYRSVIKTLLYQKKTFPVEEINIQRIRVIFTPATAALPKIVGIREITVYSTEFTRTSMVYSKILRPSVPFTDVRVDVSGQLPGGSKLVPYVATSSGGPWTELNPGVWTAIDEPNIVSVSFRPSDSIESAEYRGLFGFSNGIAPYPAAHNREGVLEMGMSQVEVTAFPKDFAEIGDSPHLLTPEEFDTVLSRKTWTSSPLPHFRFADGQYYTKSYGGTELQSLGLVRGAQILYTRDPNRSDTPYHELCIDPLGGSKSLNMLQFGYNYRFRFYVYSTQEIEYGGNYWFIQGYRKTGARPYRESGKSWGAFSIYVNSELVAGEDTPYTMFDDNSLEDGAELGQGYTLRFRKGWNKVEILVSIVDPNSDTDTYLHDSLDSGDPYLHIGLTPNLFGTVFQGAYGIQKILGSGERTPVTEFDLLWTTPRDPLFWAWSTDRRSILFNQIETPYIDGFYTGEAPLCSVRYRSTGDLSPKDLFVRVLMDRDALSRTGPTLDEYRLVVR